MSIFGKDHYIKFCITTFSWQTTVLKLRISSSQQDNTENHDYINFMFCVSYVLCLRLNFNMLHFWTFYGTFFKN